VIKHVWGDTDAYQKDLNTTQLNELAHAYIDLGYAYGYRINFAKAIESYEKAIELKPDNADAYIYLGRAYGARGDPELQISNYKEAARLGHQAIQDWLKKNGYEW